MKLNLCLIGLICGIMFFPLVKATTCANITLTEPAGYSRTNFVNWEPIFLVGLNGTNISRELRVYDDGNGQGNVLPRDIVWYNDSAVQFVTIWNFTLAGKQSKNVSVCWDNGLSDPGYNRIRWCYDNFSDNSPVGNCGWTWAVTTYNAQTNVTNGEKMIYDSNSSERPYTKANNYSLSSFPISICAHWRRGNGTNNDVDIGFSFKNTTSYHQAGTAGSTTLGYYCNGVSCPTSISVTHDFTGERMCFHMNGTSTNQARMVFMPNNSTRIVSVFTPTNWNATGYPILNMQSLATWYFDNITIYNASEFNEYETEVAYTFYPPTSLPQPIWISPSSNATTTSNKYYFMNWTSTSAVTSGKLEWCNSTCVNYTATCSGNYCYFNASQTVNLTYVVARGYLTNSSGENVTKDMYINFVFQTYNESNETTNHTNNIHITTYDEETLVKIKNFSVEFITTSSTKKFGINSSLYGYYGTGTITNAHYAFDLINSTYSELTTNSENNLTIGGWIYLGDSANVCLLWNYTNYPEESVRSWVFAKDSYNNWNLLGESGNKTSGFSIEKLCFPINPTYYNDMIQVNITFSFVNFNPGIGKVNLFEVFPETWNYTENKLSINTSLLYLGKNTIRIKDIENNYYERYYYVNISDSDVNLNAYLLSKSSNVVQSIFLITNQYGAAISGVITNIQKLINGSYVTITNTETDDAGTASFYLMENSPYRLLIMYGSGVFYYSFNALAQTYRITINESMSINVSHLFDDIFIRISPSYAFINESKQNETFSFLIASNTSSLTLYGMEIICNGTTILNTTNVTGSPSGGLIETNVDISNCNNITMKYYFQKSGYELWVKDVVYTVLRNYGYGLWKALQLMKSNFSIDFEIFIFIICLIVIISALTIFGVEGSIIAGLISFGIFTYIEPTLTGLFVIIAFASLALLMIKRRWL